MAASLNYQSGDVVGNEVLVTMNPAGGWDFRIYTFRQAHVVADAVGYFMAPQATMLDCTIETVSIDIPAGGREFSNVTCPTGYTAISGGPTTSQNAGMRVESSTPNGANRWFISVANESGVQKSTDFRARCCRIPGR